MVCDGLLFWLDNFVHFLSCALVVFFIQPLLISTGIMVVSWLVFTCETFIGVAIPLSLFAFINRFNRFQLVVHYRDSQI